MTKLTEPHFLAKESGVFLLRAAEGEGFYADPYKTPSQRQHAREKNMILQFVAVITARFSPASYTDRPVGVCSKHC